MTLDDLFRAAPKLDLQRFRSRQLTQADIAELVQLMFTTIDANDSIEQLLVEAGQEVVAPALEEIARSADPDDPDTQCNAVDMMARLNLPSTIRCIDILLAHDDIDDRYAACRILAMIEGPDSLSRLLHRAQTDPSELVRYVAIDGIERVGDASVIPILQHIAETDTGCDYEGRPIREIALKVIERFYGSKTN